MLPTKAPVSTEVHSSPTSVNQNAQSIFGNPVKQEPKQETFQPLNANDQVKQENTQEEQWKWRFESNEPMVIRANNGCQTLIMEAPHAVNNAIPYVNRVLATLRFNNVPPNAIAHALLEPNSMLPHTVPVSAQWMAWLCNRLSTAGCLSVNYEKMKEDWYQSYNEQRAAYEDLDIGNGATALLQSIVLEMLKINVPSEQAQNMLKHTTGYTRDKINGMEFVALVESILKHVSEKNGAIGNL